MQTGDGLLVRLAAGDAGIPCEAFAALLSAAAEEGSGIVEVTGRGNIQVRGLDSISAVRFAEKACQLGFADPGKPILHLSPFSARDPAAWSGSAPLASALRRDWARRGLGTLPPKLSVILDGGGALHLDALAADVRLRAWPAVEDALELSIGGDAQSSQVLGWVQPGDAVELVGRLLGRLAELEVRGRELLGRVGAEPLREWLGAALFARPGTRSRAPAPELGVLALGANGWGRGIALGFGQARATLLQQLVARALEGGARTVHPAPGRALWFAGLSAEGVEALGPRAAALGFICDAADPRRWLHACPGAPECASAVRPARRCADQLACSAAALLDGSLQLHLSGCPKGCAYPRAAALTLVGDESGYAVVLGGSAASAPLLRLSGAEVWGRIAVLSRAVAAQTGPASRALARLGPEAVHRILSGGQTHG